MLIEFLTSRFSYLIDGTLGIAAFVVLVWLHNRRLGVTWGEIWKIIQTDPQATSDFFRTRNICIAVLIGLLAIAGAIQ